MTPEDFEKSFRKIFKGDFEYRAFVMVREAGLKIIHDVLSTAKGLPGKVGEQVAVTALSAMFAGVATLAGSIEEATVHLALKKADFGDLDNLTDKERKVVDGIREAYQQSFGVYRLHGLKEHNAYVKRAAALRKKD